MIAFSSSLVKITGRKNKVRVPWLDLSQTPAKFLDVDTIPEGFRVLDPSKMTKDMVLSLWTHWARRAKANLPILIFIDARSQDFDFYAKEKRRAASLAVRTKKAHVYWELDDGPSNEDSTSSDPGDEGAVSDQTGDEDAVSDQAGDKDATSDDDTASDKGEGTSRAPVQPPPSKRARYSKRQRIPDIPEDPDAPDKQSPAANKSSMPKFLNSLSSEPAYKTLLNRILALPAFVSFFFSSSIYFA